jgi:hypothetical protein
VWWWNVSALPVGGAITDGLLRGSLKACVWLGCPESYRDQQAMREEPRGNTKYQSTMCRPDIRTPSPSGRVVNRHRSHTAWISRGGVTPFNVLPFGVSGQSDGAHKYGHGAGTPFALCDWWTRYIVPPGGVVLDPFMGSGTTGISAVKRGHDYIGVEKMSEYHAIAERRIREAQEGAALPLFDAVPEPVAVGYKQQSFAEAEGVSPCRCPIRRTSSGRSTRTANSP